MKIFALSILVLLWAGVDAVAQSDLVIKDDIQTYTRLENTHIIMDGKSELHLTDGIDPLPGSTIRILSEDAWLFLEAIRPTWAAAHILGLIQIQDEVAVLDQNVRVVQYVNGTVIIPHMPSFKPLQVHDGESYTGSSLSIGIYDYYRGTDQLSELNDKISSFRLKRGYMATFADQANGGGCSHVYIAQDDDMVIEKMPAELNDQVSFIRVLPWRWVAKKGWAGGGIKEADTLRCAWRYDWDNVAPSTLDVEYIPMRHNKYWNSYSNINNKKNSTHVLAFNEPDKSDQANMSVAEVLAEWPNLLQSGLRLGSPATSDGGLTWLYDFMERADALNYRVDFVAVHYYKGGWTAAQYYNWLKDIHQRTGRPLWVTEWNNGANWTCCEPTYDQQKQIIKNILTMLDTAKFVERYSIYNWVGDTRAMISNSNPIKLTPAGEVYRDDQAPLAYQDPKSLPLPPENLQANALSSTEIQLSWGDRSTNEVGFKIERAQETDAFVEIARIAANGTSFTDVKLAASTPYTYRIAAYNSIGASEYSNIASAITLEGLGVLPQANWTLRYVDSEEKVGENGAAVNAFDGNVNTMWHTRWQGSSPKHPHEIQIDLGQYYGVAGFLYLTRQDGNYNGTIADYEFYTSTDGTNWGEPAAAGKWSRSFSEKRVTFEEKKARYIRLVAKSEVNNNAWTCVAELNVLVGTGTQVNHFDTEPRPFSFILQQNYPNPFNPNTSIHYSIPTAGPVRLEIYDIKGGHVRTLIDREQDAGTYTVQWDGLNDRSQAVSSGLYFCRLRDKVIKMNLIR